MGTFVTNVPVSTPAATSPNPTGNYGVNLDQRVTPGVAMAQALIKVISQRLRVAAVGVVQSFDPGPPATVSVQLATLEYVTQGTILNGLQLLLSSTAEQMPLLQNVPIWMPSGGGWTFTCPIQEGDECLVVFSDTPLDAWLESGTSVDANGNFQGVNPVSQRRHSLSDAVALVGLFSKPNGIENYSIDSAQVRNADGSVVVDLADDGVSITATSGTVNVNATTINISGSTQVNIGNSAVVIGDNTTIDGVVFLNHSHSGVQPGSGSTGPVIP